MEKNRYLKVNSEKTIFMCRVGNDFKLHCLFVDDMKHVSTCSKLKLEFMSKYQGFQDLWALLGVFSLMKLFLGMQVEQGDKKIKLHLDRYVQ
jgi:hypothetical protein